MNWRCRWYSHTLQGYAAAGEPLPKASRIARHVASCRVCQANFRRWQAGAEELAAALAAPLPMQRPLPDAWPERGTAAPTRLPVGSARGIAAAVAGAALVLLLLPYLLRHSGRPHPTIASSNDRRRAMVSGTLPAPLIRNKPGIRPALVLRPPSAPRLAKAPTGGARPQPASAPGPPGHPSASATAKHAPDLPDLDYLNAAALALTPRWMTGNDRDRQALAWLKRHLPPIRDSFVEIPLPRLADANPHSGALADAVKRYEQEAKVVDIRLFRKVSLQLKAASLSDLCSELARQTGVRIQAGRGVEDEKVTAFLKERPAREVMREVGRLFGYKWRRSGEEGKYRYDLYQELRSQLAEEEMRNRDLHEALLSLDEQMTAYAPYLSLSYDEARAHEQLVTGAEKAHLQQFVANWGAIQLYNHLSPANRAALAEGQTIQCAPNAQNPDRRLPTEWRQSLLEASHLSLVQFFPNKPPSIAAPPLTVDGGPAAGTPLTELDGAQPTISVHIDRSETGQLGLQYGYGAYIEGHDEYGGQGGYGTVNPIAVGQSPSVAHPENDKANASLREQAPFNRVVTLEPGHACAETKEDREAQVTRLGNPDWHVNENGQLGNGPEPPHAVAADVWEAVHRASGLDVIADAYSHRFPLSALTFKNVPLFDALCRAGDTMHLRWQKDGDFLLGRSTSFYWDKVKEVPARFLQRWQDDRVKEAGLPLDDLLEIAGMTDTQLDSAIVGRMVERCWGLPEWGIVANTGFRIGIGPTEVRPYARLLAELPPLFRRPALQPGGVAFEQLPPQQQEDLARILLKRGRKPDILPGLRFHYDYIPSGRYVWHPVLRTEDRQRIDEAYKWPLVYGRTKEETLAAARKVYSAATIDQIKYSLGTLVFSFQNPRGDTERVGGPSVGWQTE
jgi:hypothetical protein